MAGWEEGVGPGYPPKRTRFAGHYWIRVYRISRWKTRSALLFCRGTREIPAMRGRKGRPLDGRSVFPNNSFLSPTQSGPDNRVFFDFYVSRPFSARIFYYNKQYVRNAVPPPPATNYLARSFFFLPLLIFFVSKRDDNPRDPRVLHVTHTASP